VTLIKTSDFCLELRKLHETQKKGIGHLGVKLRQAHSTVKSVTPEDPGKSKPESVIATSKAPNEAT